MTAPALTAPTAAAPPQWWVATLTLPQEWAESVATLLIEAGAEGAHIDAPQPATAGPGILSLPADPQARPPAAATLVAAFPLANAVSAAAALDLVHATLACLGSEMPAPQVQIQRQIGRPWAEAWKQYFLPAKVGRRIWIVPSWDKQFEPPTGSLALRLDPGMAFGTGQHATTALCLQAIELWATTQADPLAAARLLDVGCGSGILALAGAHLGVGQVRGIDLDAEAVRAAQANAVANPCPAQVHFDDSPLQQLTDTYDLVVANILLPTLLTMAPDLLARLRPGGQLLVSGILVGQAAPLLLALQRAAGRRRPLQLLARRCRGDWAALLLGRAD